MANAEGNRSPITLGHYLIPVPAESRKGLVWEMWIDGVGGAGAMSGKSLSP